MGSEGVIPPLQAGGVQETVTAASPAAEVETVLVLPYGSLLLAVVVAEEGFAAIGFKALQVMGTPVIVWPATSTVVALSVVVVPLDTRNEVIEGESPRAATEML
jgi:hypothetical protein